MVPLKNRQKKRKVDFDPEVLETSNLGGSTRQVPLKEKKLPVSEPEEGGRAKRPLTLDIAKAQKYSASIKTPGEEPRESHLFRFQSSTHSDQISRREKLGKYPQTLVRLDTDIDSLIAEETITPLPAEVERQLKKKSRGIKAKAKG